jgi:outer membrane protein OmpA-like peptidoglycan-associated protein
MVQNKPAHILVSYLKMKYFQSKHVLTLIALLCCAFTLSGQSVSIADLKKKDQKQFSLAKEHLRLSRFEQASQVLKKLITKYPDCHDALILQSEVQFRSGNIQPAIEILKDAIRLDHPNRAKDLFSLARIYEEVVKPDSAIHYYQAFLNSDSHEEKLRGRSSAAIQRLLFVQNAIENALDITPVKLSSSINTEAFSEYWPSFSVDGQTMIFTRGSSGQEDFFMSTVDQDGKWQMAVPIENLNTPQNEGAHSISADGHFIVFTGCNRRDGIGSCDLYFSQKEGAQWTKPKNFGPGINTPGWEGQPTLTSDGKGMYFVSNRANGLGGKDIWYTKQNLKGQWMVPKNIGSPINTPKDDSAPFLHFDGIHLYFMSLGHQGLGGGDIFMSTNHLGEWQEPVNLGYPINTSEEEGALAISPDGQFGYFARGAKSKLKITSYQGHDIYRFELPDHLRPRPVSLIEILVLDKITDEPIPALIELFVADQPHIRSSFSFQPDEKSQQITLNINQEYGMHVSSNDYVFYSEKVEIDSAFAGETKKLIVRLERIFSPDTDEPAREPIVLKNVFFKTGSAILDQKSHVELDRLVNLLKEEPQLMIEIRGHTDNVGAEAMNLELSTMRAKSVFDYLVNQEIEMNRLTYKGFGKSMPISSNETADGRQQNRRTEFLILE